MNKISSNTQTTSKSDLVNKKDKIPKVNTPVKTVENKTENSKKGLVNCDMGYDIVEDINKTKANHSLFELCNLPQQRKKLLEAFDPQPSSSQDDSKFDKEINQASIGKKSKSQTLPFLLSFKIFDHNVHNCLVDYGDSCNVMPLSICKKINGEPTPSPCNIIQLHRSTVKVTREIKSVDSVMCK